MVDFSSVAKVKTRQKVEGPRMIWDARWNVLRRDGCSIFSKTIEKRTLYPPYVWVAGFFADKQDAKEVATKSDRWQKEDRNSL